MNINEFKANKNQSQMNSERINYLSSLLSSQPDDPFIRYALALEVLKDDLSLSMKHFDVLLEKFPDYLPTYYQVSSILIDMDHLEKAKEILIKGIALADNLGENKTKSELKSLYDNLLEDE